MPDIFVEDGSNVTNANSYVDVAFLDTYAANRGLTLPTDIADKQVMLIKAFDYLEGRRSEFRGSKVTETQSNQWPRQNVCIDNVLLDSATIPEELKKAQAQLVVEQQNGVNLFPAPITLSDRGLTTKIRLGPMEKTFSDRDRGVASSQGPVRIAAVEHFLRPLLNTGGSNGWKRTIRV